MYVNSNIPQGTYNYDKPSPNGSCGGATTVTGVIGENGLGYTNTINASGDRIAVFYGWREGNSNLYYYL